MLQKNFKCIHFDDDNKRCNILIGDKGTVNYSDISKINVLNQQASFKGETKPFTHRVLAGTTFLCGTMEPRFYVGLKITLKDGTIKAVYISDRKTGFNTDIYREDKEEADKIKKIIEKKILS